MPLVIHGGHYLGVFGATKEETATTEEPRVGDESVKLHKMHEGLGALLSKRMSMTLKVDEHLAMLPGSIVADRHVNKKEVVATDGFCLVRSICRSQKSDDDCRRRARTPCRHKKQNRVCFFRCMIVCSDAGSWCGGS